MSAGLGAIVASPHFSWVGMRVVSKGDPDVCPGYVLRVYKTILGIEVALMAGVNEDGDIIEECEYLADLVLDLDDPGSKGRLLHLVREAWGNAHVVEDVFGNYSVAVWIRREPKTLSSLRYVAEDFPAVGGALVAALLAAPPKTVAS